MYPDGKFEAKLSPIELVYNIIGFIIIEIVSIILLLGMYENLKEYINSKSWFKLIWFILLLLIAFYFPYRIYRKLRHALSKGAALTIDSEWIFTKENGMLPFKDIRDIAIIEKGNSWWKATDSILVYHVDGTSTEMDIEDINVETKEIFQAYDYFRRQWSDKQQ